MRTAVATGSGGRKVLDKNYSREGESWLRQQGITPEEFLADVGLGFNRLFTRVAGGKRWVDHTPRLLVGVEEGNAAIGFHTNN